MDDVLQYCTDSDDDAAADCEPDFDPDELVMDGSDDKFSDLEGDEFDDDIDENDPNTLHDTPAASSTGTSSSFGNQDSTWSTTIKCLSIHPFTFPVGPLNTSSLKVFDLFFSPDLTERIVKESNAMKRAGRSGGVVCSLAIRHFLPPFLRAIPPRRHQEISTNAILPKFISLSACRTTSGKSITALYVYVNATKGRATKQLVVMKVTWFIPKKLY